MLLLRLPQRRTEGILHHEHASEDNEGSKKCVGVLMERWVLEVVVVDGDENRETDQ
jgi:hypothetical protein